MTAALCSETPPEEQSHRKLFDIYTKYKLQHSINVLMREARTSPSTFCQRKFIYIPKWHCREFEEVIYRMLHGLQHAIILNRTYLSHTFTCDQKMRYQAWVPHYDHVTSLLQSAQCEWKEPLDFKNTRIYNKCSLFSNRNRVLTFYNPDLSPQRIYFTERNKSNINEEAIERSKLFIDDENFILTYVKGNFISLLTFVSSHLSQS